MAKKAEAAEAKSNLTPEAYLEYARAVQQSYTALQTAQSEHQTNVKRAKNGGVDTKAMLAVMKLRRQDPEDVALFERNRARYAAWEGVKIGFQAEMFGATDDQHPTDKAAAEFAAHRAYDDGYFEGRSGALRGSNPHEPASEVYARWDTGWLAGQATIADEMGESAKKAKGRKKASGNPEDRPAA